MNFSQRSYQAELIDDLSLHEEALAQNLRELALTNYWLGGNQVTISGVEKLLSKSNKRNLNPLTIADLGCGGGDMLKTLAIWLRKKQLKVDLVGIDANAFMTSYAQKQTATFPEIRYEQCDIFTETFRKKQFDVVTMTLFCHHFTDTQLIDLLAHLKKQTRIGIVINDIHRHGLAYYSIALIARLLGASYLYQHDSKLSVLRAFRKNEVESILKKAGFEHFSIRWRWAFRWEIVIWI